MAREVHQLDESFKQARIARAERKRKERERRYRLWGSVIAVVFVAIAGGVTWLFWPRADGPADMVAGTEGTDEAPPMVFVPTLVDLAGDPLRISFGGSAGTSTRTVQLPDAVTADRATGPVIVLSDAMIATSQRFMTTLPSSPRDFEFYQSQRGTVRVQQASFDLSTPVAVALEPDTGDPPIDESGGWGGDSLSGEATEPAEAETLAVENNTSVAVVRRESERFAPEEDYKARILADRSLESLMNENGFLPADSPLFAEAMKRLFGRDGLKAGDIVAIRGIRPSLRSTKLRAVQISLYADGAYVGTLSRSDASTVVPGADPWVFDELFNYKGDEQLAEPGRQYRLLDAIYSTAVRNRVPTAVLGEAIRLLSRNFDLDAFASADDRLQLAYTRDGDDGGPGRILYASVRGSDRDMRCYVFRLGTDSDYSCFSDHNYGASATMPLSMFTPVRGTLTSTFGPRMHPIFKQVRVHTGVDWAAPTGTPVSAAFDGTVVAAGKAGGYGNLVRIGHSGGRETYYAHLSAFADGIKAGVSIKAGQLIGYVGTTGNSTGPHLHFEMRMAGTAVDPLQPTAPSTNDSYTVADGTAVEDLTNRIIQVESANNPNAKNPNSSATGLGQFISSTWLRMMRTYRPDLAASMSEAELLALRTDPTVSREMVANLAREGEAYLKSKGHAITTGRLYLCHFLGMQDAHVVLSAAGTTPLSDLLSASVFRANDFLVGHDAAWVIAWAERHMGRKAPAAPAAPVRLPEAPPEFRIYQAAIDKMLGPGPVAELEKAVEAHEQRTSSVGQAYWLKETGV